MRVDPLTNGEGLRPFLAKFGESELPGPSIEVGVLRDEGEIVGMVVQETVSHVGPTYLLPERLGGIEGALLIRHAIQSAKGKEIHVIACDDATVEVCKRLGLTRAPGELWIREA